MKKSFLIALCMVLLAGCGSGNQGSSSSENTENKPTEEPAAETASEITLDELKSYLTYHEVTADNWETIFSHGIQMDYNTDAFGEKTDTYYLNVILQLNEEYALTPDYVMRTHFNAEMIYGGIPSVRNTDIVQDIKYSGFLPQNNPILIHYNRSATGGTFGNDYYECSIVDDVYTLEFVKAIGSAVTIDIPEEKWTLDEKKGKRFLTVTYNEDEEEIKRKLYEDGYWVLLKNGTIFERFNPRKNYDDWPDDLPVNYLLNAGWNLFDLINQ